MTAKMTEKKAKSATPKAPAVVYVEINELGNERLVNADPEDAEIERDSDNRLARYKFDGFVEIEFNAVVIDMKE